MKRGRFFIAASTLLISLSVPLSTFEMTGHAATLTPSTAVLKQRQSYYKANAKRLAARYGLNYSSQTALTHSETAKVYVASKNSQLKKSVRLAMSYWNQKLGRKIFVNGTKASHTLQVGMTSRNTSADAWWRPAQQQISLEQTDYNQQLPKIRSKMINQSTATAVTAVNQHVIAYGHKIANKVDFAHEYNTYRAKQINLAEKQLDTRKRNIVSQKIDEKARTFEYANIIAHEMGHSLGLKHSANAKDAMAANSSTPSIYSYTKVKASQNGFNPLDKTDVNRAKLALAIHNAQN